jgi:hypothetical protein
VLKGSQQQPNFLKLKKPLVLIGHLAFLITSILVIIFYKERSFYNDSGQLIFEMLNEGKCKLFQGRYSMYITEAIPLLAIKAGASLKSVLIIYSLSFIFIQYICFLICTYGFKNIESGLSIALAPLMIRICFGQAVCEPWMAIGYSAVFYALFNSYETFKKKGTKFIVIFYFLTALLIAVNFFIHPLSLFMIVFSVGFACIYKEQWKQPHIYITLLLVVFVLLSKFFFPRNSYEENYFEGLKHPWAILRYIHQTYMIKFIGKYFGELFIYFLIPLLASTILLIKKKKPVAAGFAIFFCAFYILMTAISTYKGDSNIQLEIRLIPLIFMALLPLGILITQQKRSFAILGGIVLLVGTSYVHIILNVKRNHTRRLETYQYFLNEAVQYNTNKFFVRIPHLNERINSWGSAGETLMLTSLDGPENSKTIIFVDDKMHIEEGIDSYPCTFIWVSWRLYASETYLNKKYFDLKCTKYQELIYPDHFK